MRRSTCMLSLNSPEETIRIYAARLLLVTLHSICSNAVKPADSENASLYVTISKRIWAQSRLVF
jgi:hypothetical protein